MKHWAQLVLTNIINWKMSLFVCYAFMSLLRITFVFNLFTKFFIYAVTGTENDIGTFNPVIASEAVGKS